MTTQYNDLETDEINILTGALRLKQKCVKVSKYVPLFKMKLNKLKSVNVLTLTLNSRKIFLLNVDSIYILIFSTFVSTLQHS